MMMGGKIVMPLKKLAAKCAFHVYLYLLDIEIRCRDLSRRLHQPWMPGEPGKQLITLVQGQSAADLATVLFSYVALTRLVKKRRQPVSQ